MLALFVKKKLPEQLVIHCYGLNTHPDEPVFEPSPIKSWIRLWI